MGRPYGRPYRMERPQASWESRARSALAVFSTAGITKR